MAAYQESEKDKVLSIALDELRRVHDHVSNAYDQLRLKALAMIAGEVAIITFLLTGDSESKLAIPHSIAGRIFLGAGVAALFGAFVLLLSGILSGIWHLPGDMDEIEQINNGIDNRYDTAEKFLLFLKRDYLDGNRKCITIVSVKAKRVNWGLYLLLAGTIILSVIKYGGQHK